MEKSKITIPTWVFISIIVLALAGIALSVFIGYRFHKFKSDAALRYSELEQLYKLESSTLSAELESSRLHATELERLISGIQSGVSELSELNKQSSESVRLLQSSNSVIGAIFAEYARRTEKVTAELERLTNNSGADGQLGSSDDRGSEDNDSGERRE